MKSLGEILKLSSQFLSERKVDRARRLSEELIAHCLGCKRIDLYLQFDRPIEEGELEKVRDGLKRLSRGEPIEYVMGKIEFWGSLIYTDSRALIPRQETELLVDYIGKRLCGKKTVWDVCSGSGCIGISLKKKFPDLDVSLGDISEDAMALAQKNSLANGVEVSFCLGDLLTPFRGKKADLIICNPPYVSLSEFEALDPSVRDFEPRLALVGGKEGLDFYERLALDLPSHLNEGGWVFLEIGFGQKQRVQEIFSSPAWGVKEWISDLSGKDRFFFLEKQSLSSVSLYPT